MELLIWQMLFSLYLLVKTTLTPDIMLAYYFDDTMLIVFDIESSFYSKQSGVRWQRNPTILFQELSTSVKLLGVQWCVIYVYICVYIFTYMGAIYISFKVKDELLHLALPTTIK